MARVHVGSDSLHTFWESREENSLPKVTFHLSDVLLFKRQELQPNVTVQIVLLGGKLDWVAGGHSSTLCAAATNMYIHASHSRFKEDFNRTFDWPRLF